MTKHFKSLLQAAVFVTALSVTSCTKSADDKEEPGPTTSTQKGVVTGVVKDGQGNAIAGAKVRIENDFAYYDVTTNAQGVYSCKVQSFGSFKAVAWAPVNYLGQTYMLRAGMQSEMDYDFFDPANGAVRNFKLQFKGRIPDRTAADNGTGYFGASINFYKLGSLYGPKLEAGDLVTYYLTPVGTLMDGSAGQVLQGSFPIQSNESNYYVVDVPPGKYKVEAVVTRDGANYRVYVGGFATQTEATEIVPKPSTYGIGNYENGFEHPANVVYMSVR